MKIFDIDINKLASLLLPTFLRKNKITLFIRASLFPLTDLHKRFIKNRKANLYKISHNGQVCYLRAALNDEFDSTKRRIEISNNVERRAAVMFYKRSESKPVKFGTVLFSRRDFVGSESIDFIVYVPNEYKSEDIRIKAIINYYKLLSKRYTIEYI